MDTVNTQALFLPGLSLMIFFKTKQNNRGQAVHTVLYPAFLVRGISNPLGSFFCFLLSLKLGKLGC